MDPVLAEQSKGQPPRHGLAARPEHVPEHLVVDFDYFQAGHAGDIHAAFRALQESAPPLFWTPHYGGHWVPTRARLIERMQRDWAHFSSRHITIPHEPQRQRLYPQEADPPIHGQVRGPIMHMLLPSRILAREQAVRAATIELIEGFVAKGHCEFIAEFATRLPLNVFLDLVALPQADREWLRALADTLTRGLDPAESAAAFVTMQDYLRPFIRARQGQPGEDLLSVIANLVIDGQRVDEDLALRCAMPVIGGGLDTVAAMMGFIMRTLGSQPDKLAELVARRAEPGFLKRAVEELMRRHGVANPGRTVVQDIVIDGVMLRADDAVLMTTPLVGLDDELNPDPMTVDFDRHPIRHAAFGQGPHMCVGMYLARSELRILLEEWLARIPRFTVTAGTRSRLSGGPTMFVEDLHLEWPSPDAGTDRNDVFGKEDRA